MGSGVFIVLQECSQEIPLMEEVKQDRGESKSCLGLIQEVAMGPEGKNHTAKFSPYRRKELPFILPYQPSIGCGLPSGVV